MVVLVLALMEALEMAGLVVAAPKGHHMVKWDDQVVDMVEPALEILKAAILVGLGIPVVLQEVDLVVLEIQVVQTSILVLQNLVQDAQVDLET